MPKNSSPDRANTGKRTAARTLWMTVLGGVLGTLFTSWFFHTFGLISNVPPEVEAIGLVMCLVFFLIFVFMHRNADGTVRWNEAGTKATAKAPQGKTTFVLIVATGATYWLLANLLHLSENVLSIAKIVTSATVAVLCVRYVLRWRKPDVGLD